jgi:hypothetical protein
VTVSIAAETRGTARATLRDTSVRVSTPLGMTSDAAGTSRTSSNVSPVGRIFGRAPVTVISVDIRTGQPSLVRVGNGCEVREY